MRAELIQYLLKVSVWIYRTFYLPFKVRILQNKKVISVAFLISDLGKWKTERLYLAMLNHPRFNPIVIVVPYLHNDNSGQSLLIRYLNNDTI